MPCTIAIGAYIQIFELSNIGTKIGSNIRIQNLRYSNIRRTKVEQRGISH